MIWLIGREGMLGRLVEQELTEAGLEYYASGRECDVTEADSIEAASPAAPPQWVVNCTGYTAVDAAESDVDAAWRINRHGVSEIARYCAAVRARLLHISTDYVFDGANRKGYSERSATAPQNVYGASKLAGEQVLRRALTEHVIIRTAWLYAEHGRNFLLTILRLLRDNGELTIVSDQYGSPTYARDLAQAIVTMVQSVHPNYGTFHFVNTGTTTWYEYACEIQSCALELGLTSAAKPIVPVSSDRFPTAAVRPKYSVLHCSRIAERYAVYLRPWQTALRDCMERLSSTQSGTSPPNGSAGHSSQSRSGQGNGVYRANGFYFVRR